jgi:FkbH-like protein
VLDITAAPYGQVRQAILDPNSPLGDAKPDFILLALDESAVLPPLPLAATKADTEAAVQAELDGLASLWRSARERFGATILQQTILNSRLGLFGSYESAVPASPAAQLERLNSRIAERAWEDGVLLVDLDGAAAASGRAQWHDPVRWHQAKQAVAPAATPLYGDLVARVIAAASGLSRKCLVLDLDNTLWGGVVGDDGVDGIVLGQGSAAGEAYLVFQRYVAALAERGIVLALCSKNDAQIVEQVFARHPEMHLKRSAVAAAAVNWTDKATNLRSLAATLDLGLDSFVFVDDNPAERDIVRRELPMVAVPELPDDVAHYPAVLAAAGYFEAVAFTAEDGARARQYSENSQRKELLAATTDMEGFLRSLDMRLDARPPANGDLIRITQLINKSNQFNLTTRRYTAEEVERAARDPDVVVRGFRLTDKFGDNGLIAVIIARPHEREPDALAVDTWLMSCRVLGRGVETACLRVLAQEAVRRGARALIGEYRPTPRNGMVRDHYRKLGFVPAGNGGESTYWRLDLGTFTDPPCPMRISE